MRKDGIGMEASSWSWKCRRKALACSILIEMRFNESRFMFVIIATDYISWYMHTAFPPIRLNVVKECSAHYQPRRDHVNVPSMFIIHERSNPYICWAGMY